MSKWFKPKKQPTKVTRIARVPDGKPIAQFRALATFEAKELKCTYVEGMTYTLREGNSILAELLPKWGQQNLIEML